MRLTPRQWLDIADGLKDLHDRAAAMSTQMLSLADTAGRGTPEWGMYLAVAAQLASLDLPVAASYVPQSEWSGGSSDDPKNHRLKEPTIVGGVRRHFTAEELAADGVYCRGPCDWHYPRGANGPGAAESK